MFRKLTIALVATAALGTAALTSSAAEAHWRGYGWYGGYGYSHSYWNHPHHGYGYGHYGYKPRFSATRAISTGTMPAGSGSLRLLSARPADQRVMKGDPGLLREAGLAQYHRLIGPRCGVGGPILTNASSR